MNLNLFGHNHHWLMVDCGITFNADLNPTRVELPDPTFAMDLGDSLTGIVLTHAHEDHIGALPYLYERLGSPTLYATPFTAGVIREKFRYVSIDPDLVILKPQCAMTLGPFTITPYRSPIRFRKLKRCSSKQQLEICYTPQIGRSMIILW